MPPLRERRKGLFRVGLVDYESVQERLECHLWERGLRRCPLTGVQGYRSKSSRAEEQEGLLSIQSSSEDPHQEATPGWAQLHGQGPRPSLAAAAAKENRAGFVQALLGCFSLLE